VSAVGDMETPRTEYATDDALHLRERVEREACEAALLDAISQTSFTSGLHEFVRCQSEYEAWQRALGPNARHAEVDHALQAKGYYGGD
jgi:hypothetical protein